MTDVQTYYYPDTASTVAAAERETSLANSKLLHEFIGQGEAKHSHSSSRGNEISIQGFPAVDLTGFDQEAEYKSTGLVDSVLHGIKHIFVKDETVGEKVRKDVEKKMTPEERKQFDIENEALEKHRTELRNWGLQMTLEPGPRPQPPATPMHDLIQKRAAQSEREIEKAARARMSAAEIKELDDELKLYKAQLAKSSQSQDPLGTGGMRELPPPGKAMRKYFQRIAEETERHLSKHKM